MILAITLLLLTRAQAQPEQASAATPDVYRDPESGFALRLRGGFQFLGKQESIILFGSKTTPGAVFLETGEAFSLQELDAATRIGYQDEGVALLPDGPVTRLSLTLGAGVAFPVKGTLDNQPVRGILAGVRANTGRCFIVLAATTPEAWDKLAPVATQIAAGIELFTPETPPVDQRLATYFAGKRLSYYFSRGSTSLSGAAQGTFQSTERIYLCGDGSFHYGEQTNASFDVPQAFGYSRTGDSSSGRWLVSGEGGGALLTLRFHDGRLWRYRATSLGNEVVYLNGSRYFRSGQTRCR
ncbi:MAG: hypothetical protein JNL98_07900 [Bryobacterales bacterium]|nr:hypothetical protein [Bryobacterales bacterium]